MGVIDFLKEVESDVAEIVDASFDIQVVETETVPNFDDPDITFDDLDNGTKKCKLIETCVLYIDMRDSTDLNMAHKPGTLAKLYSAFIRSMVHAADYFRGYVRGIAGDRVMVVFDQDDCFANAVNTAVLFNTVAGKIINRHFVQNNIRCGIGIDYGKMLVTKTGILRRGEEREFSRSLVWLGRPANVASKLTDAANKTKNFSKDGVRKGLYYPLTKAWSWQDQTIDDFFKDLQFSYTPVIRHKDPYFSTAYSTSIYSSNTPPPILMTKEVLDGFRRESPGDPSLRNGWWTTQSVIVSGYSGRIFGGDVVFTGI